MSISQDKNVQQCRHVLIENDELVSNTPIPQRLREARDAMGISQRQLGINIGLELTVVSSRMNQYEKGTRVPDFGTLERIADSLKVPVVFFYCKSDKMAELVKAFYNLTDEEQEKTLEAIRSNKY